MLKSEDSDKWLATSQEEFDGLTEMGVWKLVDCPSNRKTIKCKWTYGLKSNGRYKARLVAKGYTQVQGIDYEETFSPVTRYKSIRYLLAHVALLNWKIEAMDVKLAYLHGVLNEELYMEQLEGFIAKGEENKVCSGEPQGAPSRKMGKAKVMMMMIILMSMYMETTQVWSGSRDLGTKVGKSCGNSRSRLVRSLYGLK